MDITIENDCAAKWNDLISNPEHDQMVGTLTIIGCNNDIFSLEFKDTYTDIDGNPTSPFARMTTLTFGNDFGDRTLSRMTSMQIHDLKSLENIYIKMNVAPALSHPDVCTSGTFLTIEKNPVLVNLFMYEGSMEEWCDFTVKNNNALDSITIGSRIQGDGSYGMKGADGDNFMRSRNVEIVENRALKSITMATRSFKTFHKFTFAGTEDMVTFTLGEDAMQGLVDPSNNNAPLGEVYLEGKYIC